MENSVQDALQRFGIWSRQHIAQEHRDQLTFEGKPIREKKLTPAQRQQKRLGLLKTFLDLMYPDAQFGFKENVKHTLLSQSAKKGTETRRKNQERKRQGELSL
ncbi:MAG: hypothetical protein Q7R74_00685 [bacterium]|nr:hypothetical protein [bacterium]